MATQAQLEKLGRLVGRSEDEIFDLPRMEALGEALDFALTLIPGWKDNLIVTEEVAGGGYHDSHYDKNDQWRRA